MQRLTISLDDALAGDFDALSHRRGYQNRSEAIRDVMRQAVAAQRLDDAEGWCVANLSYVYNHHERSLAARLTDIQHDHHDLVMATAHVHLDHDHCLETVMLQGPVAAVRGLADRVRAERGVRHGALNVIGVEQNHTHGPAPDHHHHDHPLHLSPRQG